MARELPIGLDGELITYSSPSLFEQEKPKEFYGTQSDVTSHNGQPICKFFVFDHGIFEPKLRYDERVKLLEEWDDAPDFVVKLIPSIAHDMSSLQSLMDHYTEQGYEGCCFRTPESPYRHWRGGRSTLNQQWLVKWKVFEPASGEIIGFEEEMHNANEAVKGLTGHMERSSHQANMTGKGTLGAFLVKWPCPDGYVKVGSGFSAAQRADYWCRRDEIRGDHCDFKYQPFGTKDAPRTPIFVGIRKRITLGPL